MSTCTQAILVAWSMNWITASSRLRLYVANGHSKYKGSELLSMWLERCHDKVTWLLWLRNYVVHNFASHLRWVRALLVRARDSYYHSNHSWYHWATIDPWKSTTASPGPFSWYILVEWQVVTQSQIQALAKGHLLRWCPTGNFQPNFTWIHYLVDDEERMVTYRICGKVSFSMSTG